MINLSKKQLRYLNDLLSKQDTTNYTNDLLCVHEELTRKYKIELENYDKEFITKLATIKNKYNLSYEKLAKLTNVNKNTLLNIINGNYIKISRTTTKRIKLFLIELERKKIIIE